MRSIIDKALQAILKMLKKKDERVILWKNANPLSSFPAQEIIVNLGGYDAVEVYVNRNKGSDSAYQSSAYRFRIPMSTYIIVIEPPGVATAEFYSRSIIASEGKNAIQFSEGDRRLLNLSNSRAATNEVVIPTAIYGIKFGGAS